MTDDFVTRLGLQLREAAERDDRRSAPARALRARPAVPALAATAALLAVVLAVAAAALWLRGDDAPPMPAVPTVLAELELTPNPEGLVPAFGSIWIGDSVAGTLVRVDPDSREVLARIRVGGRQYVDARPVGDELWAITPDRAQLLRIDPSTNTVAARAPLRTPGGRPFPPLGLVVAGGIVWVVSGQGALRLDPETGASIRPAETPFDSQYFALTETVLWSLGADDRLYRMDARTGAAQGSVPSGLPGAEGIASAGEDLYAFKRPSETARLDGRTGAAIWHRDLGGTTATGDSLPDLFWVHLSVSGQRDRLVRLDPATGATLASIPLDTFGATGVLAIDGEIWVNTPAGGTLVLGQATR